MKTTFAVIFAFSLFIGHGLTSSGKAQQAIAPIGATRLFLGVIAEPVEAGNSEKGRLLRETR